MADICQPSAVTTEFIFFSFLQSRVIVDSLNVPKLPSMYLFESESSNKYEKMKKNSQQDYSLSLTQYSK
jgi:hypothetical protein